MQATQTKPPPTAVPPAMATRTESGDTPRVARFNLFKAKAPKDKSDPEGYRAGMARFGSRIGARLIGGSLYELPPGRASAPTTSSTGTRSG